MRASNLIIGTTTLSVVSAALVGFLTVQKIHSVRQRSPLRIVFEGGSASGLRSGGPVNFDGVPAGQITSIKLENPRKIVALVMLDNSAPIRKDTVVGVEFQGLTGLAAISLVGGAPAAPSVPLDSDGVPVLTADLSDAESMTETLHNVDRVILGNEASIKDGLLAFESYTASLKRKGEMVDTVIGKAESVFANVDSAVSKIEAIAPSLAVGKAVELFEKMRSIHELADDLKRKSANFMDEGRRTLLDIDEAANTMSQKLNPQAAGAVRSGSPSRPQQARQ